jgi:hypothetical protein
VREFAPNFLRTALTWDFTVSTDSDSLFAICLFEKPSGSDEYQVSVDLASDSHMIAALTAIHEYVSERNHSTCVELEGRRYTLQPA